MTFTKKHKFTSSQTMAINELIKKAVAEERAKWLKKKNKSETPEYINIKGIKKISCVKE